MKYAVIYKDSYTTEGDERSRTHPGHGYPSETVTYETLKRFENQDELKRWIKAHQGKQQFTVIEYQELQVQVELVVDFKRPTVTRSSL